MSTTLTIAQYTRLCGKTRKTVEHWVASGKISSIKSDNRTLIPVDELTRLFPEINGDQITREIANKPTYTAPKQVSISVDIDSEKKEYLEKITHLENEITILRSEISTKNDLISVLQNMNEFLKSQLVAALSIADRLSTPAIPEKASVKRDSSKLPERDPRTGQFTKRT